MAKDLAMIKEGGGVVQEVKQEQVQFSDFVSAQTQRAAQQPTIAPPTLGAQPQQESARPSLEQFIQRQPHPAEESARPPAEVAQKQTEQIPGWLYAILGVIALAVIGSVGYWIVYPQVQARLAQSRQTPTPIPTQAPSPTPPAQDPRISIASLPPGGKLFTLALTGTSSQEFLAQMRAAFPSILPGTGTIALYSFPIQNANAYLNSQELARILAPKSLPSFQGSLDERYLFFAYWYKADRQALGAVFTIRPEQDAVLRPFLRGWETARIEQDFQNLFAPAQRIARTTDSFSDSLIAQTPSRMISVTKDGEPAQFIYGLLGKYLIITTNTKAFELIAQSLK